MKRLVRRWKSPDSYCDVNLSLRLPTCSDFQPLVEQEELVRSLERSQAQQSRFWRHVFEGLLCYFVVILIFSIHEMFHFCIADSEHDWRKGSEQYKWFWGFMCLSVAFIWQLYTIGLLVSLHESVPGTRYSRYLQLSVAAFGAKMGKPFALFLVMYLSGGTCVLFIITGGETMKLFYRLLEQSWLLVIVQSYGYFSSLKEEFTMLFMIHQKLFPQNLTELEVF